MKDPRLEHAQQKYAEDLDRLQRFQTAAESLAKTALASRSIDCTVSSRIKSLDSLLKKLILKAHHSYESLPDIVGLRIISNDKSGACAVVREQFECLEEEDKSAEHGPDKLGYPGVHFDAKLKAEQIEQAPEFRELRVEIQVRSYAEHAWCEVSHKFAYKAGMPQDQVPQALQRRLMLTMGLLEIADINLGEVAREFQVLPTFALSRAVESLEKIYYSITARASDRNLSFLAVEALLPLYEDVDDLLSRTKILAGEKRDVLRQVFERNERLDVPRAALFFQPETLAIYDLLGRKQYDLFDAWCRVLPEDELRDVANELGYALDECHQ